MGGVWWGGGWGGPCDYCVSPSPSTGFWIFQTWSGLRVQPGDLFGRGLGLGLALDNTSLKVSHFEVRVY